MTSDQFVAVLGGVTALVIALGTIIVQVYALHKAVNGRLSQLVDVTQKAAQKQGELLGRDFVPGGTIQAVSTEPPREPPSL